MQTAQFAAVTWKIEHLTTQRAFLVEHLSERMPHGPVMLCGEHICQVCTAVRNRKGPNLNSLCRHAEALCTPAPLGACLYLHTYFQLGVDRFLA